jgi:hypothetical protein
VRQVFSEGLGKEPRAYRRPRLLPP